MSIARLPAESQAVDAKELLERYAAGEREFRGANLNGADLSEAVCTGLKLGPTDLCDVDLAPLCCATVWHVGRSTVDYHSVLRSLHAPGLKDFLRATGMPEVFVEYMIDCARSLSPNERFTLMLSTFISYGGPDEPFARTLNQRLRENGVHTFFFPLDAKGGEWIADETYRGVQEHDRIVLVLLREEDEGGSSCLIPIKLDDFVHSDGFKPEKPAHKKLLLSRVILDFRGADKDDAKLATALPRLVDALRRPVEMPEKKR